MPDGTHARHGLHCPPRGDMPEYTMMRADTISARKKLGHKTVVVLPVHYPRELFTAMDVHTVELWGPPGPPCGPDAGRIQPYVCAVVRNALAFLASGGADAADAVLFPHTCDSIQGLATLAPDFGGWGKPALRFLHPKGEDGPAARAFVRAELAHLADELARLTGMPLALPRLAEAIGLHARIDRLRGELLSRRAFLDMADPALYRAPAPRGVPVARGPPGGTCGCRARARRGACPARRAADGHRLRPRTDDALRLPGVGRGVRRRRRLRRGRTARPALPAGGWRRSARHAGGEGVHDAAVPDPGRGPGRPDGSTWRPSTGDRGPPGSSSTCRSSASRSSSMSRRSAAASPGSARRCSTWRASWRPRFPARSSPAWKRSWRWWMPGGRPRDRPTGPVRGRIARDRADAHGDGALAEAPARAQGRTRGGAVRTAARVDAQAQGVDDPPLPRRAASPTGRCRSPGSPAASRWRCFARSGSTRSTRRTTARSAR